MMELYKLISFMIYNILSVYVGGTDYRTFSY